MKLLMDGKEYQAETAVELINQIKWMHWQADENTTPEEYIEIQNNAYRRLLGHDIRFPRGSENDTEQRAVAMFKAVTNAGGWELYEEG